MPLGAGLPEARGQPATQPGRAGLRRVPADKLPALNAGSSPSKRPVDKMSMSMPDLSMHFDRSATENIVRTPPLAGEVPTVSLSPTRKKVKSNKSALERVPGGGIGGRYDAGDGAGRAAAPFEVPLLYVGKPPPNSSHDGRGS